ncbi:MAG: hypothetical protein U9O96_02890 [Candidatus Thermoplasmatota archaeon]|nr:hypothetical protein [Candidatus Thermoplasmatota archaeon]
MKKAKILCLLAVFLVAVMVLVLTSATLIGPSDASTSRNKMQKDVEPRVMRPIGGMESHDLAVPFNGVKIRPSPLSTACLGTDVPITSDPDNDNHPAIAVDEDGNLVIMYETTIDFFDHDVIASASIDGGETWPENLRHRWIIDGIQAMPDLDFWGPGGGHHVYGTLTPAAAESGTTMLVDMPDITDPAGWGIWMLDWESAYDFYDFHDTSIAGYSGFVPEFWGAIFMLSSTNDPGSEMVNGPTWTFSLDPYMEGYWGIHWSSWYTDWAEKKCSHAKIDIDQSNGKAYGVFEVMNETIGTRDIWMEWHPNADYLYWEVGPYWNFSVVIEGFPNYRNPDVAAANENVYIVMQTDEKGNEDIMCVYSNDNGNTWSTSTVADSGTDEQYPAITTTGSTATCLYVKDGNLYSTISEDGGATWKPSQQVNDEGRNVVEEYRYADMDKAFGAWTDNRNNNNDIYFDTLDMPIVGIGEISGGFGITATITNTGTADAENVEWSISLSGLVFLGKETTDSIERVPAGAEVTVKSGLLFGIGPIDITVTAGEFTKKASGLLLGPLVLKVS